MKTGSNIGQVKGDGNILKEIEVQWTDDSTVSIDFKKLEKATKDEWVAAAREVAKEKLSQYVKTGSKIGQLKGDGDVLKEVEVQWADDSTAFVEFKTLQTATKDEWERAVREAAKKKLGKYVKTGSIWACSIGQVKGDGNVLKEIEVQWTDDSTVSVDFKRLEKATKDEWVAEVAKPRDSWLEILVASLSVDLSVYGILRVEQLIELADDAKLDEITAKETHCCWGSSSSLLDWQRMQLQGLALVLSGWDLWSKSPGDSISEAQDVLNDLEKLIDELSAEQNYTEAHDASVRLRKVRRIIEDSHSNYEQLGQELAKLSTQCKGTNQKIAAAVQNTKFDDAEKLKREREEYIADLRQRFHAISTNLAFAASDVQRYVQMLVLIPASQMKESTSLSPQVMEAVDMAFNELRSLVGELKTRKDEAVQQEDFMNAPKLQKQIEQSNCTAIHRSADARTHEIYSRKPVSKWKSRLYSVKSLM